MNLTISMNHPEAGLAAKCEPFGSMPTRTFRVTLTDTAKPKAPAVFALTVDPDGATCVVTRCADSTTDVTKLDPVQWSWIAEDLRGLLWRGK